jgi:hypothetical protein
MLKCNPINTALPNRSDEMEKKDWETEEETPSFYTITASDPGSTTLPKPLGKQPFPALEAMVSYIS